MDTSEIKVRLVAAVTEMHALHAVDAQHAERIIARLVGPYSDWLVNPEPDPQPEGDEQTHEPMEEPHEHHGAERECLWCGQTFVAVRKDSRYCSKVCSNRAYRARRKQQGIQEGA
ncbi:hypothetical protein [Meiothermus ruber]|uniref:Uncharacterized protein n=1 Tax=Meiothermus ruber (strain ATCC 35948 / DSM 1279 / VKM B-1258 / 21) TaxID=504728 RepID=D3PTE8_MEIRD|nr:hypothetical protein [Meiothermus ruber]ADD28731.1 hypothetical protein Mrub_1975 [Meiothermus ruber DSM 1279]AGK05821.1 hypothetical protein K649_12675 [Meiothermus ruber DSM 1279]